MARLSNKVAIVTGGARGIGEATARLFVEQGARVVLTDVLVDLGKGVAEDLGDAALFCEHDVREAEQWAAVVQATESRFGPVDVLVNNAGVGGGHFEVLETLSMEVIRPMIDINVIGTILGIQAVAPTMKRAGRGSIINISSTQGMLSANALSVYSATKWAVRGLTKSAALELGPKIRVNSIHPGGADTMMSNPRRWPREQFSQGMRNTPLRRACDPSEVAEGILFFASDEARYCTGAELAVDGGLTAGVYYKGLPGHYDEDS